jgi:hypothetical protein
MGILSAYVVLSGEYNVRDPAYVVQREYDVRR